MSHHCSSPSADGPRKNLLGLVRCPVNEQSIVTGICLLTPVVSVPELTIMMRNGKNYAKLHSNDENVLRLPKCVTNAQQFRKHEATLKMVSKKVVTGGKQHRTGDFHIQKPMILTIAGPA